MDGTVLYAARPKRAPLSPSEKARQIGNSVNRLVDSTIALADNIATIAAAARVARMLPYPPVVVAASVIGTYAAVEIMVAPAQIVSEVDFLLRGNNLDELNVAQQEKVREVLDRIADPIKTLLEGMDSLLGKDWGKDYAIVDQARKLLDGVTDLGRAADGLASRRKALEAVRALLRVAEELPKAIDEKLKSKPKAPQGHPPAARRDPGDEPIEKAPTLRDPGKYYRRFGPYPVVDG